MALSIMDYINLQMKKEKSKEEGRITYEEWCHVRNNGTPEEIEEAVERMMAQGGYENLD